MAVSAISANRRTCLASEGMGVLQVGKKSSYGLISDENALVSSCRRIGEVTTSCPKRQILVEPRSLRVNGV